MIRRKVLSISKIIATIILLTFTLILYVNLEDLNNHVKKNVIEKAEVNFSVLQIKDILDIEDEIVKGESIFFMDTTRMRNPKKQRELTLRQACAVESGALTHPNSKVFLVLVSPFEKLKQIEFTSRFRTLLEYPNIYVVSMSLAEFSKINSLVKFVRAGKLLSSIFIKQHTSDLVRLMLLEKYGGTYLDTDMIVMRNLRTLPHNCICRDHGFLNGAFLKLDNSRVGKRFAKKFLDDMVQNFNGSLFGWNGPFMLQRVLKEVCNYHDINKLRICDGFHVLDQNICYPIAGQKWQKNFDENSANEVLQRIDQSYMIHFWNKLSKDRQLECKSKAAYLQIARKYCPKTYQECHDFF